MKFQWPTYAIGEHVRCFACRHPISCDTVPAASGYAAGDGEFCVRCPKCKKLTYYDRVKT